MMDLDWLSQFPNPGAERAEKEKKLWAWPATGSVNGMGPVGNDAPLKFETIIVAFVCKEVVGTNVTVMVFCEHGQAELWPMFFTQKYGTLIRIGRESSTDTLQMQHGRSVDRSIGLAPIGAALIYLYG